MLIYLVIFGVDLHISSTTIVTGIQEVKGKWWTFEDVLVCDVALMALLTLLFLSLSTEHVVFCVCYVSLQFLD